MTTAVTENILPSPAVDPEIEVMLEAGVHLGHSRSRRHPAMAPYIWGVRNNVEIIDLIKTKEKLEQALEFLKQSAAEGKLLLFVGTRPSAKDLIQKIAAALGYPYVNQRWIGGTLTNFKVILKRIETLEGLEQDKASGGFEKYTKKEQLRKEEEMSRLRQNFDSLRPLRTLPAAVVVVGISANDLTLREANRLEIPVVALTDTNTNPRLVTYPIPANDDARPAVAYMLEQMRRAITEGRLAAGGSEPAASEPANLDGEEHIGATHVGEDQTAAQ